MSYFKKRWFRFSKRKNLKKIVKQKTFNDIKEPEVIFSDDEDLNNVEVVFSDDESEILNGNSLFEDKESNLITDNNINLIIDVHPNNITEKPTDILNNNIIRGCFIDIGIKTFTIYFEEFNRNIIQNINKKDPNLIKKVCNEGRRLMFFQTNFKPINTNDLYFKLYQYLLSLKKYFDFVDFIGIEEQVEESKGNQKLEHHTYAFFISVYGDTKNIFSYQASKKTKRLNAPKEVKGKENKSKRKKWAVKTSIEIFKDRKDNQGVLFLCRSKKADDYSDTVISMQAVKIDVFINKSIN